MKRILTLAAAALAVSVVFLAFGLLSDDSDASTASTFGSDSVGAERIVFDSNGGSGGYVQYVLNGNSVYFPTEYKAPIPARPSPDDARRTPHTRRSPNRDTS